MGTPTAAQEITDETVRSWLREAKVPEPWDAESIAMTVRNLEPLRLILPAWRKNLEGPPLARRAQKAIDELRRVLPLLLTAVAVQQEEMHRLGITGPGADAYQRQTKKVENLQASLVDIDLGKTERSSADKQTEVEFARAAYDCFKFIVPQGSINRSEVNPAMLFVRQALSAAGFEEQMLTSATLEGWLNQRRMKADRSAKNRRK